MLFKKKKHLTLRQVHELYLLLLPSLDNKYLVDEIDEILSRTTKEKMEQALGILGIKTKKKNGLQILTLFIKKIKEVDLLGYAEFLQGIKGNDKRNS